MEGETAWVPLFKFLFFINCHVINVNLVEIIDLFIVKFSLANYFHEFESLLELAIPTIDKLIFYQI